MKIHKNTRYINISLQTTQMSLSENDCEDLENIIQDIVEDYMENEIENMYHCYFHDKMKSDIEDRLCEYIQCEDNDDFVHIIEDVCNNYFSYHIPPRSSKNISAKQLSDIEKIEMKLKIENYLNTETQEQQKSDDWHLKRHSLLTASNAWKIFGSECVRNSLIYEKCKPFQEKCYDEHSINLNSTLQWGNIFEKLSIMLYCKMNNTSISQMGCKIHSKYPYLGASPDGINTDETSMLYGRMIEVKNIINREITGIPKDEYWIQMQLQMEIWDLNECDFIETRFKIYEEKDFYEDNDRKQKGVLLDFIGKMNTNKPFQIFMPLDIPLEQKNIEEWISNEKMKYEEHYVLFKIHYWYLDEISIVLVQRNPLWFDAVLPKIKEFWEIIQREKMEGYEHRRPKQKEQICLVKIND